VNILSFIDVKLLKDSIAKLCPDTLLTADERARNSIGKVLLYTYALTARDTIPSVNKKIGLQDILECHSRLSVLEEPDRSGISFKPELVPGTQIPFPGFPSLNVLPIESTELMFVGLNCFGTPSKYPTMVLKLHKMPQLPPAAQLADNIIGKSLYINWPMMHEARCVGLSDATGEVRTVKEKKVVKQFTEKEADQWQSESEMMVQQYLAGAGYPGSGGVQIGDIQVRLKLLPLQGMKTNPANGSTKKFFGQEEAEVPLQLCLVKAPAPDPRFEERGPLTVKDRFPVNSNVILTKGKYRGCQGTVIAAVDEKKVGVKVRIVQPEPPFGLAIARSVQESYVSSSDAAKILKLNPGVFGKITGSLKVDPGRYDLGLNLKYAEGLYVVGYTRQKQSDIGNNRKGKEATGKVKAWSAGDSLLVVGSARPMAGGGDNNNEREERIMWEYSPKAIKLISMYKQKFPQLFFSLAKQVREKKHTAMDLFGANGVQWLPKIREWLNNVETAKLPRSPLTTEGLPKEAVLAVQRAADVRTATLRKGGPPEESLVKISSSALYREGSTGATNVLLASDINDDEAPELGDRVVNLCANGIPFGLRGTVVSIHEAASGCVEVVMDEEFIGGANLQGTCSNFRGKLCVWNHFLKISPANSKTLVDQLIPKGSGKAAANKIISSIEQEDKTQAKTKATPSEVKTDSAPRSAREVEASIGSKDRELSVFDKPLTPSRGKTSTSVSPLRSSSRPRSTGRGGRQGAWREARSPDEHGTGFKERKGKSGLSRWERMKSPSTNGSAGSVEQKPSAPVATTAAGLKAVLGVSSPSNNPAASTSDATAGLKAMLGVAPPSQVPQVPAAAFPPPPPPPPVSFPQPPPPPPTAADKLLQLMASKQSNGQAMGVPSASPGFVFTYVEEGQTAPPAPPPPSQRMGMPYGSGMMAPMAPYPMSSYPMSSYPVYGMPPGGMPHPMMMQMPMPAPAVPRKVHPSGTSGAEFPPLGGAVKKGTDMATEIVPSVVASKARK
jgi:5'-3' exoribonuclease 1